MNSVNFLTLFNSLPMIGMETDLKTSEALVRIPVSVVISNSEEKEAREEERHFSTSCSNEKDDKTLS